MPANNIWDHIRNTRGQFVNLGGGHWLQVDDLVQAQVDADFAVRKGDLLYYDTDDAKSASTMPDQGTEGGNQQLFHDLFLGIALSNKSLGYAHSILVATRGTVEYDVATMGSLQVGDILGPANQPNGTQLFDQKVREVANVNAGLGRCLLAAINAKTVIMNFESSMVHGGTQAIA